MQLLQRPSPADVLRAIIGLEAELDLASLSLLELSREIDTLDNDDPRKSRMFAMLIQTQFKLAQQYMQLAMDKASFGIVGNNWYNIKKPQA